MKLYLSSYKLGDEPQKFRELFSSNINVGYIPNALDSHSNDKSWLESHIASDMQSLTEIGLNPELLDLKIYFSAKDALQKKLHELGGVWISGGNVFILRQAMKLSGFDEVIQEINQRPDFVYGGYSAGCCVLSENLEPYKLVDNPDETPYSQLHSPIFAGLNLINYIFLPHFESEHSESADINNEVAYCKSMNLQYKTLHDGEVIIENSK